MSPQRHRVRFGRPRHTAHFGGPGDVVEAAALFGLLLDGGDYLLLDSGDRLGVDNGGA
jgi:hypothetical protein